MIIITILGSIFMIAAFALLIRNFTPIKICPVCAGVAGTWLWLLGGIFAGFLPSASYQLPAAVLMGGSVVGIAYQLEKKLLARRSFSERGAPQKSSVIFKMLFIPAGFVAMHSLLLSRWIVFFPAFLFSVILAALFIKKSKKTVEKNKNIEKIKKDMEDCC